MKKLVARLLGGQLQPVLIACFSLVAALTVGLNTVVILRVITDYLDEAMDRRVARDMDLANAFYQLKLDEVAAVADRMVHDPQMIENLPAALQGQEDARALIDQVINRKVSVPGMGGTHLVLVLDRQGRIALGHVLSGEGASSTAITEGDWSDLPIVQAALSSGQMRAATEIIPAELLQQVGLDEQALITLIETPKETLEPYDPREGTAGLALTSVYPVPDGQGNAAGAVLIAYLFNNDFTLVDRIKEVAGIDTVTVFFGDLRVSTNVMTEKGDRAVGTRISQEVFDVVLAQGLDYVGRAFVVNNWFITRYDPLTDFQGNVVGSLYVGAHESAFQTLVQTFNRRVALIALISIVLAGVIAVPIARLITRPITTLVEANRQLAQGNMTMRVQPGGTGELAELGHSFNKLAETLHATQQELLHKERLASMGQLAAGVAHEINNPLGTILLFSELLFRETSEGDPMHDDLRMIINETNRCKVIVADLLNFARQQEVLAQEVDVNVLIEKVVEVVSLQPIFERVEVVYYLDPDLPIIQADPAQLEQVFVNLINNAAEAMNGVGAITLATRPVNQSYIEIQMTDTGCGIPEANLGRIFTPFFTTKVLGKGIGLGLSIVYGIIKMHSGQITVQSDVGQGTTFTITLPVKVQKRNATPVGFRTEALA